MSPPLVCAGAMCACSFGSSPSPFNLPPPGYQVFAPGPPAATIKDSLPMVNITPFGMCSSPSNPAVIANEGTPAPCIPATGAPWVPTAPNITIGGIPVLTMAATCMCAWAGLVTIVEPGQPNIEVL